MITIDDTQFPIVVARVDGDITLEDVQSYSRTLEGIFARKIRCGIVWLSSEHTVSSSEARRAQNQWMKQQRPIVAEVVAGFAWVVQNPAQLLLYKPMLALQGKRMMGCPTTAFGDFNSAVRWVKEQLGIKQ